jgi:hypothetical protein
VDATRMASTVTFNFVCLKGSGEGGAQKCLSVKAQKRDGLQVQVRNPEVLAAGAHRDGIFLTAGGHGLRGGCMCVWGGQFRVDDMELAGEMVQDLCRYLQLDELESTATFPAEMEGFREVLSRVEGYNAQRAKMTADMADVSNRLKMLVIKAEDARILGDMQVSPGLSRSPTPAQLVVDDGLGA